MPLREMNFGHTWQFRLFKRIISKASRGVVVDEYIRSAQGDRILDVGYGYESLKSHPGHANYFGIDNSPEYIDYANRQHEYLGRFFCSNITEESASEDLGHFDVVKIIRALLRLNDMVSQTFLSAAKHIRAASGRLATVDSAFTDDQSAIARLLFRADIGRFVRTEEHDRRPRAERFKISTGAIRINLFTISNTHFATVWRPI